MGFHPAGCEHTVDVVGDVHSLFDDLGAENCNLAHRKFQLRKVVAPPQGFHASDDDRRDGLLRKRGELLLLLEHVHHTGYQGHLKLLRKEAINPTEGVFQLSGDVPNFFGSHSLTAALHG
ncbi:hypothetical protein D3C72_2175560 [compost metagenome]